MQPWHLQHQTLYKFSSYKVSHCRDIDFLGHFPPAGVPAVVRSPVVLEMEVFSRRCQLSESELACLRGMGDRAGGLGGPLEEQDFLCMDRLSPLPQHMLLYVCVSVEHLHFA